MWLSVCIEEQIVCIWSSCCHCHSKTLSSFASFKSRLVLAFSYLLTQVVLEKRLLNECSSSSTVESTDRLAVIFLRKRLRSFMSGSSFTYWGTHVLDRRGLSCSCKAVVRLAV